MDEAHIKPRDRAKVLQEIIDGKRNDLLGDHIKTLVMDFLLQTGQNIIDNAAINNVLKDAITTQKRVTSVV